MFSGALRLVKGYSSSHLPHRSSRQKCADDYVGASRPGDIPVCRKPVDLSLLVTDQEKTVVGDLQHLDVAAHYLLHVFGGRLQQHRMQQGCPGQKSQRE